MRICSLRLADFRNYEKLELSLDPGTNLFLGENAQGKTNILEAVYLCGTTRSHRGGKDREMIRFGCEESHLRMLIDKNGADYQIDMHLKKARAKGIAVNGSAIRRAGDLIGLGHFVFFSPEDLAMIKNGPAERRKFLDMELCQLYGSYVSALSLYNRALLQRNRVLKDLFLYGNDESMLDVWDEQLVRYGVQIMEMRSRFVKSLSLVADQVHRKLTGGKEELRIVYEQSAGPEIFARSLREGRARDLKMKTTGVGPHRDDLSFFCNDNEIRKYGSQGQQRTTALSLKLSEIEMVRQIRQDTPVLLLDDVLSELDENRQRFLLESIENIQTLITAAGVENFRKNGFPINRLYRVQSGTVQEEFNG